MIRPPTCPICDKLLPLDSEAVRRTFPFCSPRCRQVDFFRWLDGRYAIVEPLSPDEMAEEAAGQARPSLDDAE